MPESNAICYKGETRGNIESSSRRRGADPSGIVVVHKQDGGLYVCGDFKVTINPVICLQIYPLPTPEELFSALANEESYSKLDVSRAYKQMKVEKVVNPY